MKYEREQKTTIFVVILTAFVTTFTGSALNLSIPEMGQQFHVSAGTVGWLVTAYMLTVAALSVPFGRIADRTGKKWILVIGIFLFSASSAAAVFGFAIWMLIGLRIAQGIGGAMIFSTNIAVLVGAFSEKERGKILGYSIASTYTGLSAGPVIGGLLNYYLGWRSIFALTAAIGFLTLIVAWRRLPGENRQSKKNIEYDVRGSLLYIAAIVLIMYGLSELDGTPLPLLAAGGGLGLGVLFVIAEKKTRQPVVRIRVFQKNPAYTCANLAALLNYGSTFAISYLMSIYLQSVMGYSSQAAGFILLVQPALMALLSPLAGRLSDRLPPSALASAGMALCAAGLFLFSRLGTRTSLWMILAALVITGIGFALFSSPNTNAVMACVDKRDYSVASSILATMRSIGHTLSMAAVTMLTRLYVGDRALGEASPQMLVNTMRVAFLLFAAVCAAGVAISLKGKTKT